MPKYLNGIKRFPNLFTNSSKDKRNGHFSTKTKMLRYFIHKRYLLSENKKQMSIKKKKNHGFYRIEENTAI